MLRLLVFVFAMLGSGGIAADELLKAELAALRAEMTRLLERVAELEARLASDAGSTEERVTSSTLNAAVDTPRSLGSSSMRDLVAQPRLSVGGRVKLDLVFNEVSSGRGIVNDVALDVGQLPLDNATERGQTNFNARSSRLWLKSWTSTGLGDAGAYLEFDLYGGGGNERVSNGYNPRLRHGYAELGGLTFGQTFSTFMNVDTLAELNDDGGSVGTAFARQPLLRYSANLAGGRFSLALESPETTLATDTDLHFAPDDDRMPDVVAKYQRSGYWGNWSLALLTRHLRVDDRALGADDSSLGIGASAAGYVVLSDSDTLRISVLGGNAVGRYLDLNAFADARLTAAGTINPTPMFGGSASWQHWWSRQWRSNLAAGYARQNDSGARPEENEQLATVHANLLWSPLVNTTLGVEWIAAHRRLVGGRDNALWRLQFSALHKF